MGCFSAFLEMNLIDEAIRCLKNMEVRSVDLEGLFELPLTRQLPFLMYLNEKKSHDSLIHARLLLLGINEVKSRYYFHVLYRLVISPQLVL